MAWPVLQWPPTMYSYIYVGSNSHWSLSTGPDHRRDRWTFGPCDGQASNTSEQIHRDTRMNMMWYAMHADRLMHAMYAYTCNSCWPSVVCIVSWLMWHAMYLDCQWLSVVCIVSWLMRHAVYILTVNDCLLYAMYADRLMHAMHANRMWYEMYLDCLWHAM